MRLSLLSLTLLLACHSAHPGESVPRQLTDRSAREAIGRVATVSGPVAQVKAHTHSGFGYLNFGARFPDHTFAVLIPDSVLARFGDLTRFEGHEARVTGTVWLQEGRWPAITLTDPALLELVR